MSVTIKIEQPNLPEGEKLSVSDLGELVNGQETEISDDVVNVFEIVTGTTIADAVSNMYGGSIVTSKGNAKKETASAATTNEKDDN